MSIPLTWLRGPEYWYDKVDSGAEGNQQAGQDDEFELYKFRLATLNRRWRWVMVIAAVELIFFILGLVAFGGIYSLTVAKANSTDNLKVMSNYSPVLNSINVRPKDSVINGTAYPPKRASFSRAEPNDTNAEAQWAKMTQNEYFPVSRPDMMFMGIDLESSVQIPDESFGLGPQQYLASLDSVNKLRCLNLLRKAAFADYQESDRKQQFTRDDHDAKEDMRWLELRQCTDILAQDIMCHADTELVTYKFRDMQKKPIPDLSVKRKCRSWDEVMAWQDEHKVDRQKVEDVIVFDGDGRTKLVENERGFYERNGFDGSVFYPFGNGFND